jgi:hypothetical protein
MPLLESIDPRTLDILLTAASLTVKRVKRYPGWILQQTYNLKSEVETNPDYLTPCPICNSPVAS